MHGPQVGDIVLLVDADGKPKIMEIDSIGGGYGRPTVYLEPARPYWDTNVTEVDRDSLSPVWVIR